MQLAQSKTQAWQQSGIQRIIVTEMKECRQGGCLKERMQLATLRAKRDGK
jgi:hypothetical protein